MHGLTGREKEEGRAIVFLPKEANPSKEIHSSGLTGNAYTYLRETCSLFPFMILKSF